MAYGILKRQLEELGLQGVEIRTAGVMTIPGLLPTQECRQILLKDEIDVSSHRSSKMTPELLKRANLILGMTSFHVQMALRLTDEARGKTYLLKEYVGLDGKNSQIQDPMGCTLEVYKRVYREIRRACRRLAKMDLATPGPAAAVAKKAAASRKKAAATARAKKKAAAKAAKPSPKPKPARTAVKPAASKKAAAKAPAAGKKTKPAPAPKAAPKQKLAAKKRAPKKPTAKNPVTKKKAAAKPAAAKRKPAARAPASHKGKKKK